MGQILNWLTKLIKETKSATFSVKSWLLFSLVFQLITLFLKGLPIDYNQIKFILQISNLFSFLFRLISACTKIMLFYSIILHITKKKKTYLDSSYPQCGLVWSLSSQRSQTFNVSHLRFTQTEVGSTSSYYTIYKKTLCGKSVVKLFTQLHTSCSCKSSHHWLPFSVPTFWTGTFLTPPLNDYNSNMQSLSGCTLCLTQKSANPKILTISANVHKLV